MRRYKAEKWISIFFAMAMLNGCSGTTEQEAVREVSLYDRGLAVLQKIDSMAESEAYSQIMTTSPEVLEILKEIGEGSYSEPQIVYEVKISLENTDFLQELYGDSSSSFEEVPEELRTDLQHRLVESVPTIISANNGTAALAAVSIATGEDYFIDNHLSEEVLYFYVYEGKYWGAVTFTPHEEGIVAAIGRFAVLGELGQDWDKQKFQEVLDSFGGFLGAEITEIARPEN